MTKGYSYYIANLVQNSYAKMNLRKYTEQECIPVGCVPAAHWPYAAVFFPGGGSPWSGGSASSGGVLLGSGGVLLGLGGSASSGGVLLGPGGGVLQRPHPPVDRITDTCKNITLATTSLRPVKTTLLSDEFWRDLTCNRQWSKETSQSFVVQECIPVGCVPAAHWPYAAVFFPGGGLPGPGGVCLARGGGFSLVQGGWFLPGPGGFSLVWGGLPFQGGFSLPGDPSPCEQNHRHV